MTVVEAAREKIKPLPINIDGALAAVLHDLGFEPVWKLVFIIGRVVAQRKRWRKHPRTPDAPKPREVMTRPAAT